MRFYGDADVEVHSKPELSPVTAADEAANIASPKTIRGAFPDDAILSEESPDDEARLSKRRVWIVDPLDGTRDFLAQTGDFCVLVGLAIDGAPVMGVAYQPVKDALYFAAAARARSSRSTGRRARWARRARSFPARSGSASRASIPTRGWASASPPRAWRPRRADGRVRQAHGARARRNRRRDEPVAPPSRSGTPARPR